MSTPAVGMGMLEPVAGGADDDAVPPPLLPPPQADSPIREAIKITGLSHKNTLILDPCMDVSSVSGCIPHPQITKSKKTSKV